MYIGKTSVYVYVAGLDQIFYFIVELFNLYIGKTSVYVYVVGLDTLPSSI